MGMGIGLGRMGGGVADALKDIIAQRFQEKELQARMDEAAARREYMQRNLDEDIRHNRAAEGLTQQTVSSNELWRKLEGERAAAQAAALQRQGEADAQLQQQVDAIRNDPSLDPRTKAQQIALLTQKGMSGEMFSDPSAEQKNRLEQIRLAAALAGQNQAAHDQRTAQTKEQKTAQQLSNDEMLAHVENILSKYATPEERLGAFDYRMTNPSATGESPFQGAYPESAIKAAREYLNKAVGGPYAVRTGNKRRALEGQGLLGGFSFGGKKSSSPEAPKKKPFELLGVEQ